MVDVAVPLAEQDGGVVVELAVVVVQDGADEPAQRLGLLAASDTEVGAFWNFFVD